jgi:hypothetical protein
LRATFGYSAICVPDAHNLDACDNVMTDFVATPVSD